MTPGTELLQVTAISADKGLNNVLTYGLSEPDDHLFYIHPDTGEILDGYVGLKRNFNIFMALCFSFLYNPPNLK